MKRKRLSFKVLVNNVADSTDAEIKELSKMEEEEEEEEGTD